MTTFRGNILTPDGAILISSTIESDSDGIISSILTDGCGPVDFDFTGKLIVPGFVDVHVHGGGGADFMDGTIEAARTVARVHARYGTTSLLATTLTASRANIDEAINAIVEVIESPGDDEARIRGIHLEGPYICSKRRGAQPEAPIRPPDVDELAHWIEIAPGYIKKITLAPEIPGATEFIRWATGHGVVVSIGHTDADCSIVEEAIEAGASSATHLFNAMTPMSSRIPGAVGALLSSDTVDCELICDGVHVAPQTVKVAVRAKGADRMVLITDAMSGASMPDGNYTLGGQKVNVSCGKASFDDGTLAGSVLTMNQAFVNIQRFVSATVGDASKMCSSNASKTLGLTRRMGSISVGSAADLAVLDPLSGSVAASISGGKIIYDKS